MKREGMKPVHVGLVTLALVMVAWGAHGGEPPRFPLIWQARSAPNGDRIDVTRTHDPEAGVNCYVASGPGHAPSRGSIGSNSVHVSTEIRVPSISCVKVK